MQHVATWKEGDEKWAYHKDAFAHMATHKVSLDPYRLESRRILACIKDVLPAAPIQRVEKASVDEVFVDLSAHIHSILLERYPEISGPAPYDDPTECLPRPPTTALDWNTDALVDLDNSETEDDDPDWDDIAMLIGSEIVRSVRAAVYERLKYTCSAGIARNKMMAKLGSAHKKPNQQTIVRNRAVQQFLAGFKFTKIRNLGGKLGDQIVTTFGTDQVKELVDVSLEQLKSKLGEDTGSWVYQVIRGEESSEVNSRTQIKSMLSAKSFRPSINTFEQGVRWLRIFAADIFSRLVEEGVMENKRRPKTINLHHRQGAQMRSRQAPISSGRPIDEALLFDLAKNLLGQVVVDGRAWPCANLQLSVGGFEDGPTGNRGIGGFLVRGEEAKAMKPTIRDEQDSAIAADNGHPRKRRKVEEGGIQRFFPRTDSSLDEQDYELDDEAGNNTIPHHEMAHEAIDSNDEEEAQRRDTTVASATASETKTTQYLTTGSQVPSRSSAPSHFCSRCNKALPVSATEEHEDWHIARQLQAQERTSLSSRSDAKLINRANPLPSGSTKAPKRPGGNKSRVGTNQNQSEKGQSRLVFGR